MHITFAHLIGIFQYDFFNYGYDDSDYYGSVDIFCYGYGSGEGFFNGRGVGFGCGNILGDGYGYGFSCGNRDGDGHRQQNKWFLEVK